MASQTESSLYVKGCKVNFEEDLYREFKGHRNISQDELPKIAVENKFRKPISRNLCGFLNTGLGGVVYSGILDDGTVYGLRFTEYQKDHVRLVLQDTFQRFDPPVDETMYIVRFVPVLDSHDVKNEVTSIPEAPLPAEVDEQRDQPHMLRTDRYCWCETDALARHNAGVMTQEYVLEIEILPWNPESKLAVTPNTPLHPLFMCEDGCYYIRRLGGLQQLSLSDVIEIAETETRLFHEKRLTGLEKKIKDACLQSNCGP